MTRLHGRLRRINRSQRTPAYSIGISCQPINTILTEEDKLTGPYLLKQTDLIRSELVKWMSFKND
jgi:hypothetical protein